MFIKPANLGSSVGIHKVKNEKEFAIGRRLPPGAGQANAEGVFFGLVVR